MSAGRVRSWFWDVSDSTGRSCWRVVTRPISDRSGYNGVVTRPVFRSIRLLPSSDPTGLGSGLNIVKPDSTGFKYYQARLDRFDCRFDIVTDKSVFLIWICNDNVTGILIATRFVINCPLHMINCPSHNFGSLQWPNRTRPIG